MIASGHLLLVGALIATFGAFAAGLAAARPVLAGGTDTEELLARRARWLKVAERSLIAALICTAASTVVLLKLLAESSFEVAYVWGHTSSTLALPYKLTALWAGQEGSLLFWALVLLGFSAILIKTQRDRHRDLMPVAICVIAITTAVFLYLTVAVASPFQTIWEKFPEAPAGIVPREGAGMNPMLQNPGMIIHPPLLYLGYVGFTLPFAFAIAALVSGHLGPDWMRSTRRWSLVSWLFLGLGIIAGAKWAYVELGWGGYWAWDPVENVSLIPWLTATAYIHSVMIEERRGMFRVWNLALIMLTFLFCIFGTFLTRSGLLSSVHSFAASDVGKYFSGFLALAGAATVALIAMRWKELKAEHRIESFFSREAAFLFNNVILVSMAFAVLWGTVYPIISEWTTGEKATVAAPYFNTVMLPLGIALFLITALGPVLGWRQANPGSLKRHLGIPAILSLIFGIVLFAFGVRPLSAVIGFALSFLVIAVSVVDLGIAARVRKATTGEGLAWSYWVLMRRNGRRYGGYVVHVGMAFLFVGVLGSFYNLEEPIALRIGEEATVMGQLVRLDAVDSISDEHREGVRATVTVTDPASGDAFTLNPEISLFNTSAEGPQQASEVAIKSRVDGDFFVVLNSIDESGRASLNVRWNALVGWVWFGSLMVFAGSIFALIPAARLQTATAPAAARSLSPVVVGTVAAIIIAALIGILAGRAGAEGVTAPMTPEQESQFNEVRHALSCLCGCNMTVGSCTHEHCSGCEAMESRVIALMEIGQSPSQILATLESEQGKQVLAVPPQRGVDLWIAWVFPFAAVVAAGIGGALLLNHWRKPAMVPVLADSSAAPAPVDPEVQASIARALESYR
jgi:cytochrome c-type biogenesis protein CcmF